MRRHGGMVLTFLICFCIAADLFVAWGRTHQLFQTAELACSFWPYMAPVKWMFSSALVQYAGTDCTLITVNEPTISIIFFMLKLNLTVLLVGLFWLIRFVDNNQSAAVKEYILSNISDGGSLIKYLKQSFVVSVVFLPIFIRCLMDTAFAIYPSHYPTGVLYIKIMENIAVFAFYFIVELVYVNAISICLWLTRKQPAR